MVPITREQNIICSKTRLDITTHEQTIICRQLFAGHAVGSSPMESKKKNVSNDDSIYCGAIYCEEGQDNAPLN